MELAWRKSILVLILSIGLCLLMPSSDNGQVTTSAQKLEGYFPELPDDAQSTTGPTPPPNISRGQLVTEGMAPTAEVVLSGVPAYIWKNGCGPTAAGMVIGYWDGQGFVNLVSGDASTQTTAVDAMISSAGNYTDYCLPIDYYPNMLPDKSENPPGDEHPDDSVADFMYTSQSVQGNYYGWSWYSHVDDALEDYVNWVEPAYTAVATNINWDSHLWATYVAEINAGRPVVFLVDTDGDGSTDHFVTGYGYRDTGGTLQYACHDTWDSGIHWYTFRQIGTGTWGIHGMTTFEISGSLPGAFAKSSPADRSTGNSTSPMLSWISSSGATSYEYCLDTIDNDTCDTGWVDVGNVGSKQLSGLDGGMAYFWQVRARNPAGFRDADGGTWWSFATEYSGTTATCPFSDGFESGVLGTGWSAYTTYQGRVQVATGYPRTGTYSLLLDNSVDDGVYSYAAGILALNLSGQTQVDLDFWWREFNDENDAPDGVFISDNYGLDWYPVLSFNYGPSSYQNNVIDIDQQASYYGLTLNDHFRIKFQFYDNWPITSDGYCLDDLQVTCGIAPPDIAVWPPSMSTYLGTNGQVTQQLLITNNGASNLVWNSNEHNISASPVALPASPSPVEASSPPAPGDPAVAREHDIADDYYPNQNQVSAIDLPKPDAPESVLWSNGPLVNSAGTGVGGADESILQESLGMGIYGFGQQVSPGNRIADDFTVNDDAGWTIQDIVFFAYQTGSPTTSTITAVNYRVWDGPPGQLGSKVIFGDTTTNRLSNSSWSGIYRVSESGSGSSSDRPIMVSTVNAGFFLMPGTYWLDWQSDGTLASGPWVPPITINGQTTTGDALQYTGTWNAAIDSYSLTPQGFPFIIQGEIGGACTPLNIPWWDLSPSSGTVLPGGSAYLDSSFDASGMVPGAYLGTLCITSNDPDQPQLLVPLRLDVLDSSIFLPATLR